MRRHAGGWGVPLLVFVAAEAFMLLVALVHGSDPLRSSTWTHWDSFHYLRQALDGATLRPCTTGIDAPPNNAPPGAVCGDAAWFPGYPLQIRALHALGLAPGTAGLLLATGWSLATLVAAWRWLLDRRRDPAAVAALVFLAFIPGAVYYHAIFPMSCAAFFVVCLFGALRRERWGWAAAAGAGACLMHSAAAVGIPLVVAWLWLGRDVPRTERVRRSVLVGGAMAVATVASIGVIGVQAGVWDAYLQQQAGYGNGLHFPAGRWRSLLLDPFSTPTPAARAIAIQLAFTSVLLVALFAAAVRRGVRGIEVLALAWTAALFLYPLSQTSVSVWRSDSLALIPAVLLLARGSSRAARLAAAGAMLVAVPMTLGFISDAVV